ncbi:MAG: hypothetical protein ACYCQK_06920 [Acidiferrobacteraceae bacterium]
MRLRLAGVALLVTAGCSRPAPKPSPPVSLPTLRRPVITLHQPVSWIPQRKPVSVPAAVSIPRAALTTLGGLPGVFVLNAHHVGRFRLVRIGRTGTRTVQILSGLSGRETLIVGNLGDVHDGSPIVPEGP